MSKPELSNSQTMVEASASFVGNLRRAIRVSSEDENGEITQLTQQELAEMSGVGRSTIAAYLKDDFVNPDLKTICRLASALNVPPAFLLIRPRDWIRLGQAVNYYGEATQDGKFLAIAKEIAAHTQNPVSAAEAGLKLAKVFDIYRETPAKLNGNDKISLEIRERNNQAKKAILATSAVPPFGKIEKRTHAAVLSLCAVIADVNPVRE